MNEFLMIDYYQYVIILRINNNFEEDLKQMY